MELHVELLTEDARPPLRATEGAAGFDIFAIHEGYIAPGYRAKIGTGIALAIPPGHCGILKARSSLATKNGIIVLAGVIDSDYRGELIVALYNSDKEGIYKFEKGDRIAQLLIQPVAAPSLVVRSQLNITTRGNGGFGSTGK